MAIVRISEVIEVGLLKGKTQYASYKRLGEPQSRSGGVGKISPPPEFDPRIVV